jgi:hypothetical protein
MPPVHNRFRTLRDSVSARASSWASTWTRVRDAPAGSNLANAEKDPMWLEVKTTGGEAANGATRRTNHPMRHTAPSYSIFTL